MDPIRRQIIQDSFLNFAKKYFICFMEGSLRVIVAAVFHVILFLTHVGACLALRFSIRMVEYRQGRETRSENVYLYELDICMLLSCSDLSFFPHVFVCKYTALHTMYATRNNILVGVKLLSSVECVRRVIHGWNKDLHA